MTCLECAWISDETQRLQRGKPAKRGVGSSTWTSRSQPEEETTSSGIPKNNSEVRSLTERVSESDKRLIFELGSNYPIQLVISTR